MGHLTTVCSWYFKAHKSTSRHYNISSWGLGAGWLNDWISGIWQPVHIFDQLPSDLRSYDRHLQFSLLVSPEIKGEADREICQWKGCWIGSLLSPSVPRDFPSHPCKKLSVHTLKEWTSNLAKMLVNIRISEYWHLLAFSSPHWKVRKAPRKLLLNISFLSFYARTLVFASVFPSGGEREMLVNPCHTCTVILPGEVGRESQAS